VIRRFGLAVLTSSLLLAPGLARAEQPIRVWVLFTDHGRTPAQIEAELALRRMQLGPRTLTRRAKVRDDALVDARDLEPAHTYVEAVERTGARLRVASRWLNAVSVDADRESLRALEGLPFVRGILPVARAQPRELDWRPVGSQEAEPSEYGPGWEQLELIGVPTLHDCGLTGAGVSIGVQDTGFALDHQAYADTQVLGAHDFLDEDDIVGPQTGDPPNQHIHGTLVLATITGHDPGNFRGVAPGVAVLLSKTEHQAVEEPFEEDVYVEGLEWIEAMGADIFSASLMYSSWYTAEDYDGATAVSTVAIEIAIGNGLIVFTAMGNAGPDPSTLGAPADAAGAISLGAVNVAGELAPFSSRGPTADDRIKPDVLAPGWAVYTVDPGTVDGYVQINGTSFSTPIAAGVGALLLEAYPWLTPAEMAELLRSTASQADAPDNDHGHGIIDAAAAGELFCTCIDADRDFYFDEACGGTDCADDRSQAHPGAVELCNGLDDDCDGAPASDELDLDRDGHLACADDCDDDDEQVHPGAIELCDNERDDDCDGLVDALDPDCDPPPGDGDGEPEPGESEDGDSGTEGQVDTGESGGPSPAAEGESGCACTTEDRRRPGGVPLLLLGLLVARRAARPTPR